MRAWIGGPALAVVGGLALGPAAALGQQQGAPPPGQPEDTTELVFQREVFSYPSFERRNPFEPLVGAGEQGGPRFEELRLLGIIHSTNPELSVALLTAGAGAGGEGTVSETFRVRQGQTLGNSRVVDIQPSRVIMEVTEFGISEQRVLELQRPAEGGPS